MDGRELPPPVSMKEAASQVAATVRVSDRAADVTLSVAIALACLTVFACCCCLTGFIKAAFDDNTAAFVKSGLFTSIPLVRY